MSRYLKDIIKKHKSGRHAGIYSVCSASDWVLKAALNFAKQQGTVVLIESTANQVNQFGGYTGMQPHDFAQHVYDLARDVGLAHEQVLLGGDHLGPVVWANEPETVSMQKARDLIQAYIRRVIRRYILILPCVLKKMIARRTFRKRHRKASS